MPLIAVGIPLALFGFFVVTQNLEVLPEAMFPVMMAFQVAFLVGLLTLLIWFPFFSPLRRRTRIAVILVLAAGLSAWISQIKRVEFYGTMGMRIYYRGDKDPREAAEQYLASAKPTEEKLSAGDVVAGKTDHGSVLRNRSLVDVLAAPRWQPIGGRPSSETSRAAPVPAVKRILRIQINRSFGATSPPSCRPQVAWTSRCRSSRRWCV
ncbi:MAG: hypothetical protein K2X38_10045 [Gemmataceae bacterium]|nr:hypothetical protein [Gemmataceae bacterium]